MVQGKFKILSNQKISAKCFRMEILAPEIARKARPGQFAHLLCHDGGEPLLRRPFSFHRIHKDRFEILYKIIGRGTMLLSKRKADDSIDVVGPLGNGFSIESGMPVLIAGGMGAAPVMALADKLVSGRKKQKVTVLIGAGTKTEILCEQEFKELGCAVQIATDDGTKGFKGFVTEVLAEMLSSGSAVQSVSIYACGPKLMLKETACVSALFHQPAQGALEEMMACGVGACLGCVVETREGYKRVCKDGPVFDLAAVKWE